MEKESAFINGKSKLIGKMRLITCGNYTLAYGTLCGASRRVRKEWEWYGGRSHLAAASIVRTAGMGQWYVQIFVVEVSA